MMYLFPIRQSPLSPFVAQALEDRQVGITLNSYNMIVDAQDNEPLQPRIHHLYENYNGLIEKLRYIEELLAQCKKEYATEVEYHQVLDVSKVLDSKDVLIKELMIKQEYSAALEKAEALAYTELETRQEEKTDFVEFTKMEIKMAEESRTITDLTEEEVTKLESMKENYTTKGLASKMILEVRDKGKYEHPVIKPELASGKRSMEFVMESDEEVENGIMVIPNPAHNEINIVFDRAAVYEARIYNTELKLMMIKKCLPNSVSHQIDCQGWPGGMYIIELHTTDGIHRTKIVKISDE